MMDLDHVFDAPDAIDPCDVDFTGDDELPDENVDALVLFADVRGDEAAIEKRKAEYKELFG